MHIYRALQDIAILAATMLYLFLVTRGFSQQQSSKQLPCFLLCRAAASGQPRASVMTLQAYCLDCVACAATAASTAASAGNPPAAVHHQAVQYQAVQSACTMMRQTRWLHPALEQQGTRTPSSLVLQLVALRLLQKQQQQQQRQGSLELSMKKPRKLCK
jgi:hypothetical protein